MPEDGGSDPPQRPAPQRLAEEVIRLDGDDALQLHGFKDRPRQINKEGKGKSKGKGKGKDGKLPEPSRRDLKVDQVMAKFERGGPEGRQKVTNGDRKLNDKMKRAAKKEKDTKFLLAKGEVLQTGEEGYIETEGLERTRKLTQEDLLEGAAQGVAKKKFSFKLPYGPYHCGFTKNGQWMVSGGAKGHIALMQCDTMDIAAELNVKETIRAVQPLHNQTMFAVAQKKYVYIYDNQGIELHCIKDHKHPTHMDFLPYHYLLVTSCEMSDLHYRDISTGKELLNWKTKLGPARSMTQNPTNGVIHLGHSNGTVTLWSPTVRTPLASVFCQSGHVTAMSVRGNYMATAGAEGYWKVWDMRMWDVVNTFKSYGHSVSDMDFSMTGLLSVGFGGHVEVWKGACNAQRPKEPYITQNYTGKEVTSVRFRPYEDVLGVGHSGGFESLLVPGAGYANFDSFEANPFETKHQRREKEVRSLLEKLQPDSIMLDPARIGNVDKKVVKEYLKEQEAKEAEEGKKKKEKKKMRGKNKSGKRMKKKAKNEGKEQRDKTRARIAGEDGSSDESSDDDDEDDGDDEGDHTGGEEEKAPVHVEAGEGSFVKKGPAPEGTGASLARFYGKRRRKT